MTASEWGVTFLDSLYKNAFVCSISIGTYASFFNTADGKSTITHLKPCPWLVLLCSAKINNLTDSQFLLQVSPLPPDRSLSSQNSPLSIGIDQKFFEEVKKTDHVIYAAQDHDSHPQIQSSPAPMDWLFFYIFIFKILLVFVNR